MSPPLPPVAAPVVSAIEPVVPLDDVPDVKVSAPLVPNVPAFDVRKMTDPLDVVVPFPAVNDMNPPVLDAVVVPDAIEISPPTPVVPVPTLTRISPLLPCVAAPEKSCTDPELPELVVPDSNTSPPLTPKVPAFADLITMEPLDLMVPTPEVSDT